MPSSPPDFARSVFVCSKPLQVLNCASIARHFAIADARLHVISSAIADVDGFRSFFESSRHREVFSSVSWDDDHAETFARLGDRDYETLFVEDDRVGRYRTMVPHRTERMVLFEEGIGTYRMNPENSLGGLRWLKWRMLALTTGCGWEFGSGRLTDLVAVSRPDVYRRLNPKTAHKAIGFPGLVDELELGRDTWHAAARDALGNPGGRLGRVALVLAMWGGTGQGVLDEAVAGADTVFYKAHPHDGVAPDVPGVAVVGGSWIPAEALVETLAAAAEHVTVYHHSSSVEFYLRGRHANVEFVDLLGLDQLRDVLAAADG